MKTIYIIALLVTLAGIGVCAWFAYKVYWDPNRPISKKEKAYMDLSLYLTGEMSKNVELKKQELAVRSGIKYNQLLHLAAKDASRALDFINREACGLSTEDFTQEAVFTDKEIKLLKEVKIIEDESFTLYWPLEEKLRAKYGVSLERSSVLLEKRKAELLSELGYKSMDEYMGRR